MARDIEMKNVSAIVLAAGLSRRFGTSDKLMARFEGRTLLEHVLDCLAGLGLGQIVVVTRRDFEALDLLRRDPDLTCIVNETPEAGMGSSLALGAEALKPCTGVFVVLADMPFITPDLYRDMATDLPGHDIVVPVHAGQRGHPVLFASTCFNVLQRLEGDQGARGVIDSGSHTVKWHETHSSAVRSDIDTQMDLRSGSPGRRKKTHRT